MILNFYLYICKDLTNILSEAYMLFIMSITFIQLEIFWQNKTEDFITKLDETNMVCYIYSHQFPFVDV
jgi:hypothetical protein